MMPSISGQGFAVNKLYYSSSSLPICLEMSRPTFVPSFPSAELPHRHVQSKKDISPKQTEIRSSHGCDLMKWDFWIHPFMQTVRQINQHAVIASTKVTPLPPLTFCDFQHNQRVTFANLDRHVSNVMLFRIWVLFTRQPFTSLSGGMEELWTGSHAGQIEIQSPLLGRNNSKDRCFWLTERLDQNALDI